MSMGGVGVREPNWILDKDYSSYRQLKAKEGGGGGGVVIPLSALISCCESESAFACAS